MLSVKASTTLCRKGLREPARCRNTTLYPASSSPCARLAPLSPVLKLSMKRTILASRGTSVPPEVTRAVGRPEER